MAALIDNANVTSRLDQNGSTTSASLAVTVGASDNYLLVVIASINMDATAVTYGGVSMAQYTGAPINASVDHTTVWLLANPAVGTANVIATKSATTDCYMAAVPFSGVNTASAISISPTTNNSGANNNPTVTGPSPGANDVSIGYTINSETSQTSSQTILATQSTIASTTFSIDTSASAIYNWTGTGTGGNLWLAVAFVIFGTPGNNATIAWTV